MCKATNQERLIEDPRFADQESRFKNCPELVAIFDDVFLTKTRDEWMDIFVQYQLMFSSVQQMEEVLNDPQALANDYITNFVSPSFGELKVPGYPIHFSANRTGMRSFAPEVGEHTDIVLKALGYGQEEIDRLTEEGIVKGKE